MEHLRTHLDQQLEESCDELMSMGGKVAEMLEHTCELLEGMQKTAAESTDGDSHQEALDNIIKQDQSVDNYEMSIDDRCMQLIATEQPVATDLRRIISIIKVTSDLERIGDIARYIATILKKEIPQLFKGHVPQIVDMYRAGIGMFGRAVKTFVSDDAKASRAIAAEDDSIDEQHREIQRAIIHEMKSEPEYIKNGQRLLAMTRLIELLGDRVTSICEWTIFSAQGKHIDLN